MFFKIVRIIVKDLHSITFETKINLNKLGLITCFMTKIKQTDHTFFILNGLCTTPHNSLNFFMESLIISISPQILMGNGIMCNLFMILPLFSHFKAFY